MVSTPPDFATTVAEAKVALAAFFRVTVSPTVKLPASPLATVMELGADTYLALAAVYVTSLP